MEVAMGFLVARDLDTSMHELQRRQNEKKWWLDTMAQLLSKKVYKQWKTIEFFK